MKPSRSCAKAARATSPFTKQSGAVTQDKHSFRLRACPAAGQARNRKLCLSCVTAPDCFVKGDVALAAFAHDREGFIVAQLRFYLRIIPRVLSYNGNGKAELLG